MAATGLNVFDTTLQKTNVWLNEVDRHLGTGDKKRSYECLRAVLHALRDRLPIDEAAHLGAQLPMLVRGIYYEGWRPATNPVKERRLEPFLDRVALLMPPVIDAEQAVRAVFGVLAEKVSTGEIDDVKQSLPAEVRALWP